MRCICATRVFRGGKLCKEWRGQRRRIQKLVFKYFRHKDLRSWCAVSSKLFRKKLLWLQTIVDLLVSEEQRQRERRERQGAKINRRRASEEDSCEKMYAASEACLLIAEGDRVLCLLICFNRLFALDLQYEIQLLSRFFCYSWLACLLVCG